MEKVPNFIFKCGNLQFFTPQNLGIRLFNPFFARFLHENRPFLPFPRKFAAIGSFYFFLFPRPKKRAKNNKVCARARYIFVII